SAVTDIGTGTLTVMAQIAADELGLPIHDVTFAYADSKMPFAPIQGGSFTVATVGSAIKAATKALRKKMFKIAKGMDNSPFGKTDPGEVNFENGRLILKNDPEIFISFENIVKANKGRRIKTTNSSVPNVLKLKKYSRAAHSAAFVELEV